MKLFKQPDECSCQTCQFGRMSADLAYMLCFYRGIVSPGDYCKKYSYNPLNRVPRRQLPLPQYTKEEFEL